MTKNRASTTSLSRFVGVVLRLIITISLVWAIWRKDKHPPTPSASLAPSAGTVRDAINWAIVIVVGVGLGIGLMSLADILRPHRNLVGGLGLFVAILSLVVSTKSSKKYKILGIDPRTPGQWIAIGLAVAGLILALASVAGIRLPWSPVLTCETICVDEPSTTAVVMRGLRT